MTNPPCLACASQWTLWLQIAGKDIRCTERIDCALNGHTSQPKLVAQSFAKRGSVAFG
jgi:hypothetical protein